MKSFQGWYVPAAMASPGGSGEQDHTVHGATLRLRKWSPDQLSLLLSGLRESGRRILAEIPVQRLLEGVDRVAQRFLDAGDPLRTSTLESMAPLAGYSDAMAEVVLGGMVDGWRASQLRKLLTSEFPDPGVLDGFRPGPHGGVTRAMGFPLAFHLGAGTVPGVSATSMIRSLLVKSAVLLRPAFGDVPLSVAFAKALSEELPEIAGCFAVLHWARERTDLTGRVLSSVDLVAAYGSDETLDGIRERLPLSTRFVAYRHRVGVAFIGREALERGGASGSGSARQSALEASRAVSLFDQRGCVSPHAVFVEEGGEVSPELWADFLADALQELERELPSGPVGPEAGVGIQQVRGAAELAEGLGRGWVRHGAGLAPWTVTVLQDEPLMPSCLNRVVRVIPVEDGLRAVDLLEPWARFLQSVGVEGFGDRGADLEDRLARMGVSRIVSLAAQPWPDAWWHHDGGSPLRDLVRWTDAERK